MNDTSCNGPAVREPAKQVRSRPARAEPRTVVLDAENYSSIWQALRPMILPYLSGTERKVKMIPMPILHSVDGPESYI